MWILDILPWLVGAAAIFIFIDMCEKYTMIMSQLESHSYQLQQMRQESYAYLNMNYKFKCMDYNFKCMMEKFSKIEEKFQGEASKWLPLGCIKLSRVGMESIARWLKNHTNVSACPACNKNEWAHPTYLVWGNTPYPCVPITCVKCAYVMWFNISIMEIGNVNALLPQELLDELSEDIDNCKPFIRL